VAEEAKGESRETLEQRVATQHRTAAVLVLALTGSIVAYVVLGFLLLGRASSPVSSDLRLPLYGAAAAVSLAAIALRRVLLFRFRLENIADRRGVTGVLKHLFTVTVIGAALAEAVGMIGLIMVFFGGDQSDLIRVAVVALVVMLYNYPRLRAWKQAVEYFSVVRPRAYESH
jgi:hypothetical protein